MAYDSKYGQVTVENDSPINPLNDSDEPVFILRAQDKVACDTIEDYIANLSDQADADQEFIEKAGRVYDAFAAWQNENPKRMKVPD